MLDKQQSWLTCAEIFLHLFFQVIQKWNHLFPGHAGCRFQRKSGFISAWKGWQEQWQKESCDMDKKQHFTSACLYAEKNPCEIKKKKTTKLLLVSLKNLVPRLYQEPFCGGRTRILVQLWHSRCPHCCSAWPLHFCPSQHSLFKEFRVSTTDACLASRAWTALQGVALCYKHEPVSSRKAPYIPLSKN